MQVAFCILAHDDPVMLERLLTKLAPYAVVVHLDRRTSMSDYFAHMSEDVTSAVDWVEDRHAVHWGGFSVVEAMLDTLRSALREHPDLEYVVFLSGHCYPIKPVDEFIEFLRGVHGKILCNAAPLSRLGDPWHMTRVTRHHWFDLAGAIARRTTPQTARGSRFLLRSLDRRTETVDPTLQVVAGSQWMALPAGCARDVISLDQDDRFGVFRNSYAPDEMAIQTYIHNTPWRNSVHDDDGHRNPRTVSQLPNYHYVKPQLDGFLDLPHVKAALNSQAYFARKLASDQERELELIDTYLRRCR